MTPHRAAPVVGPRTKGLRLDRELSVAELLELGPTLTGDLVAWPVLTLDDAALTHNVTTMARVCALAGVEHAPHVKTAMSAGLFARQQEAGAWGATVANAHQLRAVLDWGADRVLVANELPDPRDWSALARHLATSAQPPTEVLAYVDSDATLEAAVAGLRDAPPSARAAVAVLVELGVPGGRTGAREVDEVVRLALAVVRAGLTLAGVSGYEGSAASRPDDEGLAAVTAFCHRLADAADELARAGITRGWPVVSAGGSAFVDVVLGTLTARAATGPAPFRVLMRSGAYLTHDHGLCARNDPWARLPAPVAMQPAATVWAQVLSVPEPGTAVCGAGRRDLPYDVDLPVVTQVRRAVVPGTWAAPVPLSGAEVHQLDDQHLYVRDHRGGAVDLLVGDVVGLGISHPCTLFDKWRAALVVRGEDVVDVVTTDF